MIKSFQNNFVNVLEKMYYDKYNIKYDLNMFHTILETSNISEEKKKQHEKINILEKDRNSIFYDDYHNFIDINPLFNEVYYKFIQDYVIPLYGYDNKIVFQKTPNLRISFPKRTAIGKHEYENENENVIGIHKDSDFGHDEDEINFIIPITEMYETNSLYYEPYIDSKLPTNEYVNLSLKKNEFFIGKLNKLLHYNKMNETGVTRISLDFRIIPYEKYMKKIDFFKNTKFELGKYYILSDQ